MHKTPFTSHLASWLLCHSEINWLKGPRKHMFNCALFHHQLPVGKVQTSRGWKCFFSYPCFPHSLAFLLGNVVSSRKSDGTSLSDNAWFLLIIWISQQGGKGNRSCSSDKKRECVWTWIKVKLLLAGDWASCDFYTVASQLALVGVQSPIKEPFNNMKKREILCEFKTEPDHPCSSRQSFPRDPCE